MACRIPKPFCVPAGLTFEEKKHTTTRCVGQRLSDNAQLGHEQEQVCTLTLPFQDLMPILFESRPHSLGPEDAMALRESRDDAILRGGVWRLAQVDNLFKAVERAAGQPTSFIPVHDNLLTGGDSSMHLLMYHRRQRQ
jgi:hypothetical protein